MIGHRRVTHLKKGAVTYGAVSASKDWPDTSTWQILSGGEVFYECYAEWSADDGVSAHEGGCGRIVDLGVCYRACATGGGSC